MESTQKPHAKKGKKGSVYSIIGVTLVLLILGIMGWIFLNVREMAKSMKEEVRISAYLTTSNKDSINIIQNYLEKQPYAQKIHFVSKDEAKKIWNEDNNEDWDKILDYNPLPESIDFFAKENYVNKDSLAHVADEIRSTFGSQISDISYPKVLVESMSEKTAKLGIIFLAVAIVLCVIVIVSIDNTIRLIMYSNRFLIKTMQMVGATRGFIARPFDSRAVLNGAISGIIAIGILYGLMHWAESEFPQLTSLRDNELLIYLFCGMLIIGVLISLISTHRSVMKYLKTRIDRLY